MKLQRLIITGFGKLAGVEFELTDGLNIFQGPNESGKSTLQAFIRAMLYGMKEPDAKRRRYRPEYEKYVPWSGAPYGGVLEFRAEDGRTYRVERTFTSSNERTCIFDAVTGQDLTPRFPVDKRRELLFAESFLGMNELVYYNSLCIGDIPNADTEKGRRELASRLANLAESGDEATSVRKAADYLETMRRDLVTRLNEAAKRAAQAAAEWDTLQGHRAEARALENRLASLRNDEARWEAERRIAAAQLLATDILDLVAKVEQAEHLVGELATLNGQIDAIAGYAQFPVHLQAELGRVAARLEAAESGSAKLRAQVRSLDAQILSVQEQMQGMPAVDSAWTESGEAAVVEKTAALLARLQDLGRRVAESAAQYVACIAAAQDAQTLQNRFASMRGLPAVTPGLLADWQGIAHQAEALCTRRRSIAARHAALVRRFHAYRQKAKELTSRLASMQRLPLRLADIESELTEKAQAASALSQSISARTAQQQTMQEQAQELAAELQQSKELVALAIADPVAPAEIVAQFGDLGRFGVLGAALQQVREAAVQLVAASDAKEYPVNGAQLEKREKELRATLAQLQAKVEAQAPSLTGALPETEQLTGRQRPGRAVAGTWWGGCLLVAGSILACLAATGSVFGPAALWWTLAAVCGIIGVLVMVASAKRARNLQTQWKQFSADQLQNGTDKASAVKTSEQAVPTATTTWADTWRQISERQMELASVQQQLSVVQERARVSAQAALQSAQVQFKQSVVRLQQERQAVADRQNQLLAEINAEQEKLAELACRKKEAANRVLEILSLAGIAGNHDAENGLPWSVSDLAAFNQVLRQYQYVMAQVADLPHELPDLMDSTNMLREELAACRQTEQDAWRRWNAIARQIPDIAACIAEPAALEAAACDGAALAAAAAECDVQASLPMLEPVPDLWPHEAAEAYGWLVTHADKISNPALAHALASTARSSLAALCSSIGIASVEEFDRLWAQWNQAQNNAKARQEAVSQCRTTLLAEWEQLTSFLQHEAALCLNAANIAVPETPEAPETWGSVTLQAPDLTNWLAAIRQAAQILQETAAARTQLLGLQQNLADIHMAVQAAEAEEALHKEELARLLEHGGVKSADAFHEACACHARYLEYLAAQEACQRELSALLNNTSLDELRRNLAAKQAEWSGAQLPVTQGMQERGNWETRAHDAMRELDIVRQNRIQAETALGMHIKALEGETAIAARRDAAASEREKLQKTLAAVLIAQHELEAAAEDVHRLFAPTLNAKASDILQRVTAQHYEHLMVSDALDIRLTDPRFNRQVDVSFLSRGACDQVYLAFRLAAAQAICGTEWAPPIIVDDAFAHYDDVRAYEAISALLAICGSAQVLLFTCRGREVDLAQQVAQERGIACSVHALR